MSDRFHMAEPYFSMIANGSKRYEGRGLNSRMANVSVGSTITLYNEDKSIVVKVVSKKKYDSVEQMLSDVGCENIMPNISVEEAIDIYKNKFNYIGECIAIELQKE